MNFLNFDKQLTIEEALLLARMRGESTQPPPRRGNRPNLSPEDKLKAIDRVRAGDSKASVARDLGVPESTLRGWCKTELKLQRQVLNSRQSSDSAESNPYSPQSASSSGTPSRHSEEDEDAAGCNNVAGVANKKRKDNNGVAGQQNGTNTNVVVEACLNEVLNNKSALNNFNQQQQQQQQQTTPASLTTTTPSAPGFDYLNYAVMFSNMSEEQRNLFSASLLSANIYQKFLNFNLPINMNNNNNNSTVNFVDNGLQYKNLSNNNGSITSSSTTNNNNTNGISTKGNNANSNNNTTGKRISNGTHNSVVAPTSMLTDSSARLVSRQSMSPASEPPSMLIPTHNNIDYYNNLAQANNNNNNLNGKANSAIKNKQQQQQQRHSSTSPKPRPSFVLNENILQAWKETTSETINAAQLMSIDSASKNKNFWQYYKTLGPLNAQQRRSLDNGAFNGTLSSDMPTNLSKKLNPNVRAELDDILCSSTNNNNNNNIDKEQQEPSSTDSQDDYEAMDIGNQDISFEEALSSGATLLNWMTNSSNAISQLDILQFKGLLNKIKNSKAQAKRLSGYKHSRK